MSKSVLEASIAYPVSRSRDRAGERWLRLIARSAVEEVRLSLAGRSLPVTGIAVLLVVAGLQATNIWFAGKVGTFVLSQPLLLPMELVTAVGCLYVLFRTALRPSPTRRQARQQAGRAGAQVLIMARFLAGLGLYGLFLLLLVPPLLLVTWVSNLVVPPALTWGLISSCVSAGLVVAAGLFIGAASDTREAALTAVAAVAATLLTLQIGQLVLNSLPASSPYHFLRPLFRAGSQLLPYASPFAASDAMFSAALRSDFPALMKLVLATLLNASAWLAATFLLLKRKGKPS